MPENWQEAGFGLYVHWPFCQSKCPYCDFNSHVAAAIDQDRWRRAYRAAILQAGAETPGRILGSIFFGGGTPSLMAPETVAAVIDTAREAWPFANDVEITLEANPTSVEAQRFAGYRDAGVNRVSVGVQALDEDDLRRLGRLHSVGEAMSAIELARATFDRMSFDLIYARQHQSREAWRAELRRALDLGCDHLSLYQLTIESGTPFAARAARGRLRGLPDEDLAADMFLDTQRICDDADLPAYEVSNHARSGAESRHNAVYWRSGDWVGVGPGAHGRLTQGPVRWATMAERAPERWLEGVECGEGNSRETVTRAERADEMLLMGLRLSDGVSLRRFAEIGDVDRLLERASDLGDTGMVEQDGEVLRVTPQGRPVLDAILRHLT